MMKKAFPLIVVAVLTVAFALWWQMGTQPQAPITTFEECVAAGNPVMESYPRQCRDGNNTFVENIGNELEKTDLIRITTPRPNQTIKSPLTITGEARGGWFFEASFPVFLTDWDGRIIAQGIATAKSDWMTADFVPFEAVLTFTVDPNVYSKRGSLILKKDNPSGLPEHDDALEIPVVFAPSSAATGTPIKLYFYNPALDQGPGGVQCSRNGLAAVERVIPKTTTPLTDAVKLLLRGEISAEEKAAGIESEFPLSGLALKSATITNGVATLTFDDPQNTTGGGSCRVGILWIQIEATAKQFPTVKSVRFLPEELFQP